MTSDSRDRLSLIEAQLFASTDPTVIDAIDASADPAEAIVQLQALGMNKAEATIVLDMPLRVRTHSERATLFNEAERLRTVLD